MTGLGYEDNLWVDYYLVLVAGGVGNWCIVPPTMVSFFWAGCVERRYWPLG